MFTYIWRNKFLTTEARSIDEMAAQLEQAAAELRHMSVSGVTLDPDSGVEDDYATLMTDDPRVADQFGFEQDDEDE